jgi:TonB family protein
MVMPGDSMSGSEALKSSVADLKLSPDAESRHSQSDSDFDARLERLSALFEAHGDGRFSGQFSANLALEIVLNEIVEQTCLTTDATGAAIFLLRDEELVCRASSGTIAPELGARLDREKGISGECLRASRVQRCDEILQAPQAQLEASRILGARSAMLLPLARDGEVVGIFEVLSTEPSSFGERDQRALEAIAQGISKNLERAERPLKFLNAPQTAARPVESLLREECTLDADLDGQDSASREFSKRGMDLFTLVLGLAVLGFGIFLAVRFAQRSGWFPETRRAHFLQHAPRKDDVPIGSNSVPQPKAPATTANEPSNITARQAPNLADGIAASDGTAWSRRPPDQSDHYPAGLHVYQNGLQVFPTNEPAIELSPAEAQGSLIHRVEPQYPEESRLNKVQGTVLLEIHIGRDGKVRDMKVISGDPLLVRAATDAVKQWRFKPHAAEGRSVEMETTVNLDFRMQH